MPWVKRVLDTGRDLDPEIYDHFAKIITDSGIKFDKAA